MYMPVGGRHPESAHEGRRHAGLLHQPRRQGVVAGGDHHHIGLRQELAQPVGILVISGWIVWFHGDTISSGFMVHSSWFQVPS